MMKYKSRSQYRLPHKRTPHPEVTRDKNLVTSQEDRIGNLLVEAGTGNFMKEPVLVWQKPVRFTSSVRAASLKVTDVQKVSWNPVES